MRRPMKIAFAGLRHGHIFSLAEAARNHPELSIAGAWEEDAGARKSAEEMFPEPFYGSYEELLNDREVDIVAVGDYYGIRGERILQALAAGKHVIADKPLCTRLDELEAIKERSYRSGLKVGCMLDLRYDPALRLARDMARRGDIGGIRNISFTGQHPLNWGTRPMWYFEDGKHGGTFNDIAIHGVDAVRFITGMEYAKTLCARQWNSYAVHAPGFCDCAQFMGVMENGAGIMADVSYSAPSPAAFALDSYWRFTIWGANGVIECRLGSGEVRFAAAGDKQMRTLAAPAVQGSWLDDLLTEIHGGKTGFGTESVLESARTALEIQKFADETGKE